MLLAMFGLGGVELAIIGVVAVLLFGHRLPQVARQFGAALPMFRKGMAEVEQEIHEIETAITSEEGGATDE